MLDYHGCTDNELASLLRQGERLAYTEIFNRYKEVLFRHAVRFLQDRELAEDVIQDVFLMLWEKREALTFTSSLSAYLYSTVRNRIFNHMTRQKVVARYLDSIRDFMEKGCYTTDEQVRARELAAIIEKEVAALPQKMREVFLLSREESRSHKEIGELLGISDKTAKQQLYKAVKILRLKISSMLSTLLFFSGLIVSGLLFL